MSTTVVQALAAVMADVAAVGKTDRNTQQGYDFRGVDAVVNAVGPALRAHGVVVLPTECEASYQTVHVGSKQTPMRECTLKATYRFYGPGGDWIDATVWAEALDSGDKATSKAHSVAYRTALLQTLCIPTGDKDPDSESHKRSGDPLAPLKASIMDAGKERGWDMGQIEADFAEWSQGGDIRSAEQGSLRDYLNHLRPAKRMKRQS